MFPNIILAIPFVLKEIFSIICQNGHVFSRKDSAINITCISSSYFFVSSNTSFHLSWPKVMFLALINPSTGNKKRLPNRYGRSSRLRYWGFFVFSNYSWSVTGSS
jgi:hypothetical protein